MKNHKRFGKITNSCLYRIVDGIIPGFQFRNYEKDHLWIDADWVSYVCTEYLFMLKDIFMKDYFRVTELNKVIKLAARFQKTAVTTVPLELSAGRILAEDIRADIDLPGFTRSTMDGYAVCASSTFGASNGSPAFLAVKGKISMGEKPSFSLQPGEAVAIPTGGMLPEGADGVIMIEYTDPVDETAIEVYKSIPPGHNLIYRGEDFEKNSTVLEKGSRLRAAECGLLAAFGIIEVPVFNKPVIAVVSTGDEIVPAEKIPGPGQIRNINSFSLAAMISESGGEPVDYGIIRDDYEALEQACRKALENSDMLIISGGSSVGKRDFTVDVLSSLPESEILVHGIPISPGKPTILADAGGRPVWGLPGHVVSAMVVFEIVVRPFLGKIAGLKDYNKNRFRLDAILGRNIPSAQGREEYVRVRLTETEGGLTADPVPGKSGMINTMVFADGLIRIPLNTEGLDKGSRVKVMPLY